MSQTEVTQPTGGAAGDPAATSGTTGATGQQGEKTFTQAEANAFAAEAKRKADGELAKAQAKLEELSAKLMTADEKKIAEAVKAREAELSTAHAAELRGRDVRLAIAGKGVRESDIDMVAALVPADTKSEEINAKVAEILKARPYLLADAVIPGVPAGGPAPLPGAGQIKRSDIRKWQAEGKYAEHEAEIRAAMRANKILNDVE